jgi:tetratricopeptide (TPR) repeat protein
MVSRQTVSFVLALTIILALTTWLQMARERTYAREARDHQVLYITDASLMQKAALSFDALLADVYWIRAIQHFGAERLQPTSTARFELLFPLLDITTSLDPLFSQAYRFGAIFLSEPYPGGADRPDLAIKLLEKGIRADPDRWWYYHDAGFVAYWHLRDYQAAAEWFKKGSTRAGAPWWLTTYAAVMLTRGGDRQTSRFMWEQLASGTDDDWLRQTSRMRLMQLDAMDQIDALLRNVKEFASARGKLPTAWEEMVALGLLRGIPLDPSGTPYTLNFADGAVTIAPWSKLHPLPDEAVRLKPDTTH